MALPNIFTKETTQMLIARLNQIAADTQPQWGKMNAAQMLAHCNVTYEMVYTDKHQKPNAVVGFILKMLIKKTVVSETLYKKNSSTAPQFLITDAKVFEAEKARLIEYLEKTQALGEAHFEGKASHSFGNLSASEWNNMFYKHLNHHFTQFGV